MFVFASFFSFLLLVNAKLLNHNEDTDLVVNYLLDGGDKLMSDETEQHNEGGEPTLTNGVWTCGICDNVHKMKSTYKELYTVESYLTNDIEKEIQVGLSIDNMKCVTLTSEEPLTVKMVSGTCVGAALTLSVTFSSNFEVNVYDKRI